MTAARDLTVEVGGRTYHVTVEPVQAAVSRFRMSWDDQARVLDARQIDTATLSLVAVGDATGSRDVRFVETSRPGGLDVHIDGAVVSMVVDREGGPVSGGAVDDSSGPCRVVAPMPGKVVRVGVEVGDEVVVRQSVVVVEAMKMENELTASRAGRVTEIHVAEGVSVEPGMVLVVIE